MIAYYVASSPLMAIHYAGAASFRSAGNAKAPVALSVSANLFYAAGCAVAVLYLKRGIHSLGITLVVARLFLSASTVFMQNLKNGKVRFVLTERWRPDIRAIKQILSVGVPNGLENNFFQFGRMFTVRFIALYGAAHITAYAVTNTVSSIIVVPGNAVCLAMITAAGWSVGMNDSERTVSYTKKLITLTVLLHTALNVLLIAALPWIARAYRLTPVSGGLFEQMIYLYVIPSVIIWPFSFVLPYMLRAVKEARYALFVSSGSMLICRIAGGYVLSVMFGYGVLGVWIMMIVDWTARSVFFVLKFAKGKWKEKAFA